MVCKCMYVQHKHLHTYIYTEKKRIAVEDIVKDLSWGESRIFFLYRNRLHNTTTENDRCMKHAPFDI